ncbi:MAG: hypothetical protein AAFZ09_05565 [Pseudomonadota bacterium]
MLQHSHSLEFYGANPSIEVVETPRGYRVTAVESRSIVAQAGSLLLLVFCLTFLGAGVAVWFLPDSAFDGDPGLLKTIVTAATWLIFAPMVYFNFINTTNMAIEIDLSSQVLHQVFLDRHGREKKRRSVDFTDVDDLELRSNDTIADEASVAVLSKYGQIYLRLDARRGLSLVWGDMSDLRHVWLQMRRDILDRRA